MADHAPGHDKPGAGDVGPLQVQAQWNAAAEVWWAESDDLPGLATEAPSFSELIIRNRGKTLGTGRGQAGWPRQRMTSARRGTAGALGTPSRAPR